MSGRTLATADENVPVFIGVVHKVLGQFEQVINNSIRAVA